MISVNNKNEIELKDTLTLHYNRFILQNGKKEVVLKVNFKIRSTF